MLRYLRSALKKHSKQATVASTHHSAPQHAVNLGPLFIPRPPTSVPLNVLLPPEVLEEVFLDVIWGIGPLWKNISTLTLVCHSWSAIARRLELVKLVLIPKEDVDKVLARVDKIRVPVGELPRAPCRFLSVYASRSRGPYRFPELMTCFKESLHTLKLDFYFIEGQEEMAAAVLQSNSETPYSLPAVHTLDISSMFLEDVRTFLLACDPAVLRYLRLYCNPLRDSKGSTQVLADNHFPQLQTLSVVTISRNGLGVLQTLFRAAPNVTTVEIAVLATQICEVVELLQDVPLHNLVKLKVTVMEAHGFDDAPRDAQAIKKVAAARGWTCQVWMSGCCGSWLVD